MTSPSSPTPEHSPAAEPHTPKKDQQDAKKKKKSADVELTGKDWLILACIAMGHAAVPVIWMSGLGVFAGIEWLLRTWTWAIVLIALPLVIFGWRASVHDKRKKTLKPSAAKKDPVLKRESWFMGACIAAVFLGIAYGFFVHPYLVGKAYTAGSTTQKTTTNFADRAPWTVSNNFAQRDQGDVIGDRLGVHYVPASADSKATAGDGAGTGTSRYTVLVKERGMLGTGGYEAVQTLTMPTTGVIPSDASSHCGLPDDMNDRLGSAWPWHSLSWAIHSKGLFLHWNEDDAYGYCSTSGVPTIVVPLFGYEGFWNVTEVPKGAAVYTPDGVQIMTADELDHAGIQGPTYPRSLATKQREAINAGGSLTDWWGSKYGYDLTDAEDDEDTNNENSSEFTLITADTKAVQYATPLTPRGSSESLTAISTVPARQSKNREREPLTINTSPDLAATSTLETSIKESSVHGDNAWTTRWSAGMRVYEILPAQNGHWVASIGQGQAVSYRADIAPDGTVTVVNADTGQSSDSEADGGSKATDSVTVRGGKPLSEMSEAELLKLMQDATTELQKRENSS